MDKDKIDKILDFINRRWKNDCNWLNGNCYWFASILCNRFPELEIYYDQIEGHFYAGKDNQFFDWRGCHLLPSGIMKFNEIFEEDSNLYNRIVRDCIL